MNNLVVLIPTYPFTRRSAGVFAQHLLCHELNRNGYDAFLVFIKGETSINPEWMTPIWNGTESPIFSVGIYSELIHGNPLNVNGVIHWILGSDLISPKKVYETDQYLYWNGIGQSRLRLNILDMSIQISHDKKREGLALYQGKSKSWSEIGLPDAAKYSIRRFGKAAQNRQEMFNILSKVEALVISEESLLIEESILCGCPVVIRPDGYTPPDLDKLPSVYKQTSKLDWPDIKSLRDGIPESKAYLKIKSETSNATFINLIYMLDRFELEDTRISKPRISLTFFGIMQISLLRVRSSIRNRKFSGLVNLVTDSIESRIGRWKKI